MQNKGLVGRGTKLENHALRRSRGGLQGRTNSKTAKFAWQKVGLCIDEQNGASGSICGGCYTPKFSDIVVIVKVSIGVTVQKRARDPAKVSDGRNLLSP